MEKRLFSMMVSGHCFMTIRIFTGATAHTVAPALLKKGFALYSPVCTRVVPPRTPPCHHRGQGCRSFLPKICAPRYIIPSRAVFMSARSELESERYKKPVQHGKPTP